MAQIQTYSKCATPHVRRVVIRAGVRSSGGVDVAAVAAMNKDRCVSTSLVGKGQGHCEDIAVKGSGGIVEGVEFGLSAWLMLPESLAASGLSQGQEQQPRVRLAPASFWSQLMQPCDS